MKLVTYRRPHTSPQELSLELRLGVVVNDRIVDVQEIAPDMPSSMLDFLRGGEMMMQRLRDGLRGGSGGSSSAASVALSEDILAAPVPRPTSMRDGYAFRQHVEAARRNRGVEMIPEFDEIPIFYFTNHNAVYGPGPIPVLPMHLNQLDFELEGAIVIGKEGRNIKASEADSYIAGYTVMNDWSARALQMHEMKLNLGPAKGKDFATAIGPWLVTKDELEDRKISTPHGDLYDLEMTCHVNGTEVSRGNMKDMSWTFAQIIERASYGVTLYPGDVIGSGTVGTGCFLELNGSKVYEPAWWLKVGDTVTCSIDRLGSLTNTVVAEQL
jgi:fumarylacetoacetate (FAA) hydrolase